MWLLFPLVGYAFVPPHTRKSFLKYHVALIFAWTLAENNFGWETGMLSAMLAPWVFLLAIATIHTHNMYAQLQN